MRWAEHVARMKEMRNTYKILVRKLRLGRPRRRREVDIKIRNNYEDVKFIEMVGFNAWAFVDTLMKL
jgi:hypothetical protein